ncbi:MAG: prolyl oligopeptidase family serine peptidase [Candidatus Methanofastidiosia archaeon]|jgi:predicted esterase
MSSTPITFLQTPPDITGYIDTTKELLPIREFTYIFKSVPENPVVNTNYRLAYGTTFFYVFVQVDSPTYVCRDRGYQNGDGFVLILTVPQFDMQPTQEFYMIGVFPTETEVKSVIWCYNEDFIFTWLEEEVKTAVAVHNGKTGFELLLPWNVVYPYHPWVSDIGFDLFFVKAIGKTEENTHTVHADNIEGFNFPLEYTLLQFEAPEITTGSQTYLVMDRNCNVNQTITAKAATVTSEPVTERICITMPEKEFTFEYLCKKGVTTKEITLTPEVSCGHYTLSWKSATNSSQGEGEIKLTVLPDFDVTSFNKKLESVKSNISKGSYTTLQFELQELHNRKTQLYPYDTCPELLKDINTFLNILKKAQEKEDVIAAKTGLVRRAFLSTLDNTLQPYTVRIPENIDYTRKYPVIVFLHGSDVDDRTLAKVPFLSEGDFIEVAPFGRGKTHAYTTDNAQQDIQEAIKDVIKNYPVNSNTIVLSGFSMGGYGVYRTFYETPQKYTALAVFCGFPNVVEFYFPDEEHPNFLKEKYLTPFKGVPIFIYHGTGDRNAPYEYTQEAVKKLEALKADVTFCTEQGKGHEPPGEGTIKKYHKWLKKVSR